MQPTWTPKALTVALGLAMAFTPLQARELPDFTDLIEKNAPVVVNITTSRNVGGAASGENAPQQAPEDVPDFFRRFFEQMPEGQRQRPPRQRRHGTGSGMIYSSDGYIVTNHHVVDGADEIIVKLSDKREFVAEKVGSDPRSDLALLKIDADDLPTATLGNSEELKVGQWVLAIGSPFGFEHSVTAGIVSAKGRSLPSENYIPFIQTDVAINPGNSGGPLFDMDGRVVGINAQIYTRTGGFMGLSFAIPIDMVSEVIAQIKADGRVVRGWLGVYIQEVTRDLAESFGLDRPKGAIIAEITEDGPADEAGLEAGDIVLEFNGKEVESSSALPPMVGQVKPGETVEVEILRGGERKTIEVTLGQLPDEGAPMAVPSGDSGPSEEEEILGMRLEEIPEDVRKKHNLGESGIRVKEVTGDPARSAGIQKGDVIQMFAGEKIETLDDFKEAAEDLESGQPQPILVQRQQGSRWLALTPE